MNDTDTAPPTAAAPADLDLVTLHTAMAELGHLSRLAAAGGLRAGPVEPRDGQTGGDDPQRHVDRLHDRGDAARARLAHRRLLLVHPKHRPALLWLADRGDARPSVREACALLAREFGPVALRDAAERSRTLREDTERAHATAQRSAGKVLTESAARLRDLLAQRQVVEERCATRLAAWGRPVLAAALAAWGAAEIRQELP